MKKILSIMFVALFFMLVGITSVYAINATLTKDSFKWSGVEAYASSKLSCTNAQITGGNIQAGNKVLTAESGSVSLTSTNNTQVTCKIVLDKDLAGNDKDRVLVTRSIVVGTTKKATTTTKKTTTTTSSKSNNNNLKSLTIKDQDGTILKYTPDFKADEYVYTVEADSTVKKVNIQPSVEDSKANVIFEPGNYSSVELEDGTTTTITIIVTAEDGTSKKSYTVNVKKSALNSDATLKSLTIAEVKDFKFSSDVTSYDIKVADGVKKLTIEAKATNEKATIKIEGNEKLKNGSQVRVIVTSEGDTIKVYELNIVKNVSTDKTIGTTGSDKDPLVIIILSVTAVILLGAIMGVLRK